MEYNFSSAGKNYKNKFNLKVCRFFIYLNKFIYFYNLIKIFHRFFHTIVFIKIKKNLIKKYYYRLLILKYYIWLNPNKIKS